jgi:hypothetical protein
MILDGRNNMEVGVGMYMTWSLLAKTVLIASVAVSGFAMRDADAVEPVAPAGHITIARDVPAHNAFRAGDIGQPTNVATAREDVVAASTRLHSQAPQPLPDSTLEDVASLPSGSARLNPGSNGSAATFVNAGSVMRGIGAVTGRATSSIDSGVMQAIPGGVGAHAPGPASSSFRNTLSAMPGIR